MDVYDLGLRLCVAGVSGALLGLEREIGGDHNAGFRTHTLAALGACLFTLAGAYGFADIDRGISSDPSRVAAQVASGIGFLGAGAILREGGLVRGMTTATTLWIAAALGLAAGSGVYALTAITTGVVVSLLLVHRGLRRVLTRLQRPDTVLAIEYERGHGTLGPVLRGVHEIGLAFRTIRILDDDPDLNDSTGVRRVEIHLRAPREDDIDQILTTLKQRPEIRTVSWGDV